MKALSRHVKRSQIIGGIGLILVLLMMGGALVLHQRQLAAQASAPASVCRQSGNASTVNASTVIAPPGVSLPVTLPAGEPQVVATVNGEPLGAVGLELRVEATLANNRRALRQAQQQPGTLPPDLLASLEKTPNQVRHDALTQMIQECLLLQEGKRLGLTASLAAAQAMARQQLQIIASLPAADPARIMFEQYLQANHLDEQMFATDPGILQAYRNTLTIAAVKQHIRAGLPPGKPEEASINAYIQQLWQTGSVRVFLSAQLGW